MYLNVHVYSISQLRVLPPIRGFFQAHISLRQSWQDDRLNNSFFLQNKPYEDYYKLLLNQTQANRLWMPGTYITNALSQNYNFLATSGNEKTEKFAFELNTKTVSVQKKYVF